MTDEEKSEERYCKTCKKKNNCFHNCDVFIEYTKGLAEGRKEKQKIIDTQTVEIESRDVYLTEKESLIIRQQTKIQTLEKENEELKAQLKNNPYVQILQNEKSEMAEDFAKQIGKMKVIEKENSILKSIISTILDKEDICYICQMKGQVLPECMRMENSECLKNMISLWSK